VSCKQCLMQLVRTTVAVALKSVCLSVWRCNVAVSVGVARGCCQHQCMPVKRRRPQHAAMLRHHLRIDIPFHFQTNRTRLIQACSPAYLV
jgi:hypothetical protein